MRQRPHIYWQFMGHFSFWGEKGINEKWMYYIYTTVFDNYIFYKFFLNFKALNEIIWNFTNLKLLKITYICLIWDQTLQILMFNPFKPEFTIVTFIHYKPRIAVAILDLYFCSEWRWLEVGEKRKKYIVIIKTVSWKIFVLKPLNVGNLVSLQRCKWNESGFRPPLCTYRLNWARRTSWEWWDDCDDTALQTQDSKFEPWRSEAEHATSRSRRLPTILTFTRGWGRNIFCFFQTAETGNRTPNSGVKGRGANHYPRAPAPSEMQNDALMHREGLKG